MTIDERLEKLTERHEALTETVEILSRDVASLARSMEQMRLNSERDAESIRALARIAEIHDRRITRLEGSE